MNTKICTSIEQSKKLLELGLDPSTADMIYTMVNGQNTPFIRTMEETIDESLGDIPCWSLAALLELMPKSIEVQGVDFFLRILCYESDWYIDYASLEQSYLYNNQSKSLLEASILIIEQLIQKGHIKVSK